MFEGVYEYRAAALALRTPWREVAGGPQGKSKAITLDSALKLMKRPCGEARQRDKACGLWARVFRGRFMALHKRFRSRLSLDSAGLSSLGFVSTAWEADV